MKRIVSLLLMVGIMMSVLSAPVFAEIPSVPGNSNDLVTKVEKWEYNPDKNVTFSLFDDEPGDTDGSAADVVKVNVTATEKSTGGKVPVSGATVRLFVGAKEMESKRGITNSEGVAEISLAGLTLEQRLTATISADKVMSVGKAIDGTARDLLFKNYPKDTKDTDGDGNKDEYIRYQTELHSEWIDTNGNWNGMSLPKTVESNKVDIVFAIDATGSMGDEINNVKDNVAAFSRNLIEKGLDIRFSIIEYRDITCSEPTKNYKNSSGSNWYSDIDSVVDVLGKIEVDGGGDIPETAVDALGMMADQATMGWRSDAHKFAFVLTDADYKNDNNYGYENLEHITRTLAGMKVITSVITANDYKETYRILFDTTEGIYANIYSEDFNAEMIRLSDSIATSVTREIDLVLSEPRLKVGMSVGYVTDDSQSRSKSYKNSVKNVINEFAHRVAETTDGHVLIDKVIIDNANSRLSFYNNSDPVSMTDIRIESTESSSTRIGSNANLAGFYTDDTYADDISDIKTPFKNMPDSAKTRQVFRRIQMSGTIGGGWNNSFINDSYPYSTALTHETGHYLFNFFDEYLNADNNKWSNVGGRPYENFGLMDHHRGDHEMSKTDIDYSYMKDGFASAGKSQHTYQSWIYKASCEDLLASLLVDDNADDYYKKVSKTDFALGNYKAVYTKVMDKLAPSEESKDRRATYSYAELDRNNDFIDLTSGVESKSMKLMDDFSTVPVTYFDGMKVAGKNPADFTVIGNGATLTVAFKSAEGHTYELYYLKSGDEEYTGVELTDTDGKITANVPVTSGVLAEIRLVSSADGKKEYNSYYADRSDNLNSAYMYESADGSVMAYVNADAQTSYLFVADNSAYTNGDYVSVNQATSISCDNGAAISKGEIYSVASCNAEIDYSTISWFRFKDGAWTALATDIIQEENMNIGARADMSGEGIYVLMAKKASDGEVKKATDLTYTQSEDADAVITLEFDDENTNSKYYNVYYSDKKFSDKNSTDVVCRTFNADSDTVTINLGERNRVVYAAIEIVAKNGSRSPLSDFIKLEAGSADSDSDGIPDWYCDKYRLWGAPGEAKDIAGSDDDGDGLTNLEEYRGGSDPTNPNDPDHTTNVPVESLSVSPSTASVKVGSTTKLTASVNPSNASKKNVRWTVDDEKIATITANGNECTVKGVAVGTTTVYAVSEDGGYSDSVKITVSKKSASRGLPSYSVKFDSNGGTEIPYKNVVQGGKVPKVKDPVKEGYEFAGWYTDKSLTKEYNFSNTVTKNFTLYAKWIAVKDADEKNQIILTIGEKRAYVFGIKITNDVAPKIVNDRTMLPIRFIAEALGADVEWDGDAFKVTIIKDDTEMIITIDSDKAVVNGKTVTLDSPAFIENSRTYLPLRFVSENLGASVEWVEETQQVIITK